jgi:hypothetical protein
MKPNIPYPDDRVELDLKVLALEKTLKQVVLICRQQQTIIDLHTELLKKIINFLEIP